MRPWTINPAALAGIIQPIDFDKILAEAPTIREDIAKVVTPILALVTVIKGLQFLQNATLSAKQKRTRRRVKAAKKMTPYSVKRWKHQRTRK